jgi:hypothetical protein
MILFLLFIKENAQKIPRPLCGGEFQFFYSDLTLPLTLITISSALPTAAQINSV